MDVEVLRNGARTNPQTPQPLNWHALVLRRDRLLLNSPEVLDVRSSNRHGPRALQLGFELLVNPGFHQCDVARVNQPLLDQFVGELVVTGIRCQDLRL
jgi:hypothetical protein